MKVASNPKRGLDADVIIVGAGPTGLVLANLLGQYGVHTILLERNATTVKEPRAVSIDDESLRSIQAIGLDAKLTPLLASGYGSHYKGPDGSVFAIVEPTSREFGFEKRNAFQQPDLEAILRDGLSRFSSLDVRFSCNVSSVLQSGAGVVLSYTDKAGKAFDLTSRYLVGADGARSFVRKSLGIELGGSSFEQRWLIIDLFRTENLFRHTEVFCDPKRPAITLPGPHGTRRYEFMLRADESEEHATSEAFARSLLASVGPDGDAPLRRIKSYLFHARVAQSWRCGLIFLAGDAAHLSPPFAGQGMNSGIRDAHNLAWKLASAVRHKVSEQFLDSYQVERLPHARAMIDLALSMGAVMMPSSRARAVATRIGFRALSLCPPVRNYVSQMRYKPQPRFHAGLMWPDGRGRRSIVGRLFPQPDVENVAGERLRFDDALGTGPVIVLFGERPASITNERHLEHILSSGARVVVLTPDWINPCEARFPVYRDASRRLANMRDYLDHAILLRPDRYVAAAVPLHRIGSLKDAVGQMIGLADGRHDSNLYGNDAVS